MHYIITLKESDKTKVILVDCKYAGIGKQVFFKLRCLMALGFKSLYLYKREVV